MLVAVTQLEQLELVLALVALCEIATECTVDALVAHVAFTGLADDSAMFIRNLFLVHTQFGGELLLTPSAIPFLQSLLG